MPQVFKIRPYWVYLGANEKVVEKWIGFFGEATYYC